MTKTPFFIDDDEDDGAEERIRELKERVDELTGGEMLVSEAEDVDPAIREQFWRNVLAYEESEWVTHFDLLTQAGVDLPPPESLADEQLHAKLWEVIHSLALLKVYLYSTDHLSDRELYEALWRDLLREEGPVFPPESDTACHLDVLGSGSEEDMELYLRYYADEDFRQRWAKDWPDFAMPEREEPPYDRDRLLPVRQWSGAGSAGPH